MTSSPLSVGLAFLPSWLPFAPPLGITALASYLEQHCHEVQVFDFNGRLWRQNPEKAHFWKMEHGTTWSHVESYKGQIHPFLRSSLTQAAHELAQSGLDTIGFSIYSSNYLPTRFVLKLLRTLAPEIRLFVGGASVNEQLAIQDLEAGLIDAAVIGEGEDSSVRLLKFWSKSASWTDLRSTMIKDGRGNILKATKNTSIRLNAVPIPNFSQFDFDHYYGRALPIEFGRGCVANCAFCSETNYWVGYRTKSIDQIIGEMKHHVDGYGIREFRIVDSLMNGNHKFLESLCDRILAEGLKIDWYGFCRIDKKLTRELLMKMKSAGCNGIYFGVESGSQKVLTLMNKRVLLPDIYSVIHNAHRVGIKVGAEILVGFPGESLLDVLRTFLLVYRLRKQLTTVTTGSSVEVVENSELRRNPGKFNIIYESSENWRTRSGLNNPVTRRLLLRFINRWVQLLGLKLGYAQIR